MNPYTNDNVNFVFFTAHVGRTSPIKLSHITDITQNTNDFSKGRPQGIPIIPSNIILYPIHPILSHGCIGCIPLNNYYDNNNAVI